MVEGPRRYRYVGPPHLLAAVSPTSAGHLVRTAEDVRSWAASVDAADLRDPHTHVVDINGVLRLAPRRSEHVACAGGGDVLSAGEITLARGSDGWAVTEVTNHSTGYCPDVASWPAVADALDHAGLPHPEQFTTVFVFRRCPGCGERNVVKDDDYSCGVCGDALPASWNVDATT